MPLTKNELKLIDTFCSIFKNNTKDELKVFLGSKIFNKKGKYSARHWDKCHYVLEVLKKQWISKEKEMDYNTIYREGYEEGVAEMKAEIEKLKKQNERLNERLSIMSATASTHIQDLNEIHQEYGDMVRKLQEELAEKDATKDTEWHIWLNEELGDELYSLNPPMPTVFVDKVKELKEENEALEEKVEEEVEERVEEAVVEAVAEVKEELEELEEQLQEIKDNSVPLERLEEEEEKVEALEEKIKTLKKESDELEEAIELVGNQETIYACNNIWYK
jgi:chromosome segregation ATPase